MTFQQRYLLRVAVNTIIGALLGFLIGVACLGTLFYFLAHFKP